jgi:hypothetical protein
MHTNCASDRPLGISLVELLTAIAVLTVVTTVTVARLNLRAEVNQARCAHGLKETGLAFRQFANDNADRLPAHVSRTFGGAREAAANGEIAPVFRTLADYQAKPGHVICPGDARSAASAMPGLTAENLSYFIHLDADPSGPASVLLGDRDLKPVRSARAETAWVAGMHPVDAREPALEWSGVLHRRAGNLALTDGSVKPVGSGTLGEALRSPSSGSARLLFPQ